MLYNLLYPLSSDITVFNVFRYITFRSAWALATALLVSIVVGPRFIAWLQRLKCRQFIHEDVTCHMSKAGTPTMGGLLIGFAVTFSVLLWADLRNPYIWLTLLVFTGFGFIGFLDDYTKLRRRNNKGLTASAKFLWQVGVAVAAMYLLVQLPAYSTKLAFPFFKGLTPDLGWLYIPFAVAVMVGSSNGVNLTDGLDGLAIGPTIVAGIVFSIFIYVAGHSQIAGYLQVP